MKEKEKERGGGVNDKTSRNSNSSKYYALVGVA